MVSPETEEVVAGDLDGTSKTRWDARLAADNVDLAGLDRLIRDLLTENVAPANAPRAVVGMSNGGSMNATVAAVGTVPALSACISPRVFGRGILLRGRSTRRGGHHPNADGVVHVRARPQRERR